MLCHDGLVKFKTSNYHSKSEEIHLGFMGNTTDENFIYTVGCYTFLHIIECLYGTYIFWKLEWNLPTHEKAAIVYILRNSYYCKQRRHKIVSIQVK